jgi:hypothetical protein
VRRGLRRMRRGDRACHHLCASVLSPLAFPGSQLTLSLLHLLPPAQLSSFSLVPPNVKMASCLRPRLLCPSLVASPYPAVAHADTWRAGEVEDDGMLTASFASSSTAPSRLSFPFLRRLQRTNRRRVLAASLEIAPRTRQRRAGQAGRLPAPRLVSGQRRLLEHRA